MGALNTLSAVAAARELAAGKISSEALVRDCLARIGERESDVQAWEYIGFDAALAQARAADAGGRRGRLHGKSSNRYCPCSDPERPDPAAARDPPFPLIRIKA